MEIHYINEAFTLPKNTILCLGFFDGLHIGHQKIIFHAHEQKMVVALLTFDISPEQYLHKKEKTTLLNDMDRNNLMKSYGVDILIVQKVDHSFLQMTPQQFIDNYLKVFNPTQVICGYDYRFGYQAQGTPELLKKDFIITIIEKVADEKGKISTTRIVNSLQNGDMDDVKKCTSRYYSIHGKVAEGYHLGTSIGFPTANVEMDSHYYLPKCGVYAAKVFVNNRLFKAMVNVGFHPTATKLMHPLIEAHILDFNEDIYNQPIEVQFIKFIREEQKFASLEELKKQLENDKKSIALIIQ